MLTNQIRKKFIDFFVECGHKHLPSSLLIPNNDPSLLFVNSGMVQFKNIFVGLEKTKQATAVTCQKSLRAGGKHNDLDNVGHTTRHHTFFEMLGNFSFGDYFKEQAIYYAWQLLTKEFQINKEKLYITVYHTDEEAENYWRKISGLNSEHIIKITSNDNFWSVGDIGPCGPCSEIFYDHGSSVSGDKPGTVGSEGDRFVEIWNLVFMQFNQIDANTRIELEQKSIDTGMGLERIAAVMQGVVNNYDTDIFKNIILYLEYLTKIPSKGNAKFSHRIIADHIRSICFLISDGVIPSNDGRGYVLRRIIRRALLHVHQLNYSELLLYRLIPKLIELMGETYGELMRNEDLITDVLKQEEERFKTTLDKGIKLLKKELSCVTDNEQLPGNIAFKLYDTYGFPLDLTCDIAKNQNITVDHDGFNLAMEEQKKISSQSWRGAGESKIEKVWFDVYNKFGATEFLGYTFECIQAKVLCLVVNNQIIDQYSALGEEFALITNQTSFYGESGGQLGDIGCAYGVNNKIKVIDTKKFFNKLYVHICILEEGVIRKDDILNLVVDTQYRQDLKKHHTVTHILQSVLRKMLGTHVIQKGSLVTDKYLRFDFSHSKGLTNDELLEVENGVNNIIITNCRVNTALMPIDIAIKEGATALFEEKYDSEVRVVNIIDEKNNHIYSRELCGGTHVDFTGQIGSFKIDRRHEVSLLRIIRIEAMAGKYSLKKSQD